MKLNKNKGSEAIYLQIVEMVKRVLVKGNISPGTKIMSIDEYAKHLGIAVNTVAMAYTKLVKEGLLDSKKGAGFFVTRDKYRIDDERQKLILQYAERFGEEMKGLGVSIEEVTKILKEVMKEKKWLDKWEGEK